MSTQSTFEDLAVDFEGTTASGAERFYRRTLDKLRLKLLESRLAPVPNSCTARYSMLSSRYDTVHAPQQKTAYKAEVLYLRTQKSYPVSKRSIRSLAKNIDHLETIFNLLNILFPFQLQNKGLLQNKNAIATCTKK